ncbi:MAG TPA: hypothetical protein VF669_16160 [Tepidisphaeraceae bacterium]|jgi:outer membrane lipoprotein-sorting protein
MMKLKWTISFVLLAGFVGCRATSNLPMHPRMSLNETKQYLAAQAQRVKTISAEGTITLTRGGGESVRFDGAMVMELPTKARVRAWKFGQAIFDLTLNDEGMWLVAPKDSSHAEDIRKAGANAGELARTLSRLMGRYFQSADLNVQERGDVMLFSQRQRNGELLTCDVDRQTLTPTRYTMIDAEGRRRFVLRLERYEMVSDVPWPRRIVADSEAGAVQVDLRNVELNAELAAGAFKPPRRAERLSTTTQSTGRP